MSINFRISSNIYLTLRKGFKRKSLQNCNQCRNLTLSSLSYNEVVQKTEDAVKEEPKSKTQAFRKLFAEGPNLKDFFNEEFLNSETPVLQRNENVPYLVNSYKYGYKRKVYFDVYGCQMNVNDTEVVWAILQENNYDRTTELIDADVVLIITCAIRDSAEEKIWGRLDSIKGMKRKRAKSRPSLKVGILGCMAERLKEKVLEKDKTVDVVCGPDAYRDLPRLLSLSDNNQKLINVQLSFDETYADITPVRLNENSVSAYISIMRGCDNMCTYCIVPFTRGRERSRPASSILKEVEHLSENGVKEVTLLGQNVNSYRDITEESRSIENVTSLAKGFRTVYKAKKGGLRFADLLQRVADINPEMRIRFTSPHPKDFPDEVIQTIQSRSNICKNLHMPAQSGNSAVLERMRRGYTREAYLNLVYQIRKYIPDVALSSDFIGGFCGESEEEFQDTLTLMEEVKYNTAFLFSYSMREKTTAHRRFQDDVSKQVKLERVQRMIKVFRNNAAKLNAAQIGKSHLVLVEGFSKRSDAFLQGRNDQNIKVILPANEEVPCKDGGNARLIKPGDYVAVHINAANSQILKGIPLYLTGLQKYHCEHAHSYQAVSCC